MQGNQPHPTTPLSDAVSLMKRGKKRGSYNCGRCGLPKKGHNCPFTNPLDDNEVSTQAADDDSAVVGMPCATPPPRGRRVLSFDDVSVADSMEDFEEERLDHEDLSDLEIIGKLPGSCWWEILRRLPPVGLLAAAAVCTGFRETTRRLWRAAEELSLRVPANAQTGFFRSILQKCSGLQKLTLRFESDFDASILAYIAFSCPDLQSLEIFTSESSVNRISGDDLSRFIAERRCLTNLKMEGCYNLGGFVFTSSSLSTLWLSDLHSLSKMVFNCPNLKEISLNFSRQENDSTDLITAMDSLGRTCPKLQNIHVASIKLSHEAVLALSASNLRYLRMLSLVLGTEITDASVAAITSSFSKLDLLDLSGSSISDSGIGMICNVLPDTLSKLLLALCPNITSSGIQFASAQLPRLEVMDCGMTICDPNSDDTSNDEDGNIDFHRTPNSKSHHVYQKLIIKHSRLKKLSLWGCSGLDALHLNCSHLNDLNLNSCKNLSPGRLILNCPNLQDLHALDCEDKLIETIETQVGSSFSLSEYIVPSKRFPDGSKRVRVPFRLVLRYLMMKENAQEW